MSIIRYQTPSLLPSTFTPLARLSAFQHEVDRLFDLPFFGKGTADGWTPALDVHQDKDTLFVAVELPGMKREDVKLSLHDGILTLSGERRHEKAHDEKASLRNERFFGRFERSLNLPFAVDAARVAASYEDGVLTVTLPKAEEAKPRQIDINVK